MGGGSEKNCGRVCEYDQNMLYKSLKELMKKKVDLFLERQKTVSPKTLVIKDLKTRDANYDIVEIRLVF